MAGPGMDDEARGLVDDQAVRVLPQDRQRDVRGNQRCLDLGLDFDDDLGARLYGLARTADRDSVDPHAPGIDRPLDTRPRERDELGQCPVDPLPRLCRSDPVDLQAQSRNRYVQASIAAPIVTALSATLNIGQKCPATPT